MADCPVASLQYLFGDTDQDLVGGADQAKTNKDRNPLETLVERFPSFFFLLARSGSVCFTNPPPSVLEVK